MTLPSLKSRLSSLTGAKKYAAAFGLGSAMTLAMPPVGAFYILLVCVPGLIWLTQKSKTKRDAFLTGWAFGAGYFIFGLYWVSFSLFVDIAQFWWVLPLSAVIGPSILALYYGFIPLLAWRYRKNEAAHALMIAAGWALIEWIRGHAFTGFPWNLAGYTWHFFPPVMQVNAVAGIYGLTLLTLLWAIMPALSRKSKIIPLLIASFVIAATGGAVRLYMNPAQQFDHYTVRVVQPNIPQSIKWSEDDRLRNLRRHLDLTASPTELKQPVTFVIWPETAVTQDLNQSPGIKRAIARALPPGSTGILGSLIVTRNGSRYFNGVSVIDGRGNILNTYSKHHLVPFGEYIPFRNILNMTPIAAGISGIGDFSRGSGTSTLRIGTLPKPSPLVCYEAIFPGETARRDDRPDWLVNVTNDAWYGKTAGPHQHFEISRVRAIEEGLPLVRSTNTGISAVIDPLGRIIGFKKLMETGVVDAILPRPLPPTLYTIAGDAPFFLMLILLGALSELFLSAAGRRRHD